MDVTLYCSIRAQMLADPEWGPQIEWAQNVTRPADAEHMARELIFVIANSGMHHKAAQGIFRKVMAALEEDRDPAEVFRHTGKVAAMAMIWRERERLFAEMTSKTDDELVTWCGDLPFIGEITKWHALKNLGVDAAKPDRWMQRVAPLSNESVTQLCQRLSEATGDRIATVDLVIWWAMAKHVLVIANRQFLAGPGEPGRHNR